MKLTRILFVGLIPLALPFATIESASAKGCIKGAIVGGIAGKMAGHGGVGAAAGCAIGHHEANKNDAKKQQNTQGAQQQQDMQSH